MEFSDYTQILFNRIKKIEPENVSKIIGYLLLQVHGDQEIVQLAMCPDSVIQEVIYKVKVELQWLVVKSGSPPISPDSAPGSEFPSLFSPFSPPVSSRPFLSPRITSPYWEQQLAAKHNSDFMPYLDSVSDLQTQTQFLSLEDRMESVNLGNGGFSNDYCYSDAALGNLGVRTGRRHQNLPEFPVKTCHYFNKGYCKQGSNCKYFHGHVSDNFPQMFDHNSVDAVNEDPAMSREKLELELVELLKTNRGDPVPIASLPLLYYEKNGKVLQADGYLTDSQRHGKAGYSLTKPLARLKDTFRVIDRYDL
ncbi:zinc finger CCCH domain-containing protein 18-like [Durio zibethinus]|uniref:Zinc finger CCCH domain-containing protein 18-like n=1 Tax=Durio zibethinus TaxID=66656 RepID=A0A6P5Y1M5_DURZI|nr:zinc finger CCCH domain-containing protein 18-like [Durio zibethinus]